MSEYKSGQRIRIQVEGLIRAVTGPWIDVQPDSGGEPWRFKPDAGSQITVLSEPGPIEPTGLGAVVEAGLSHKWGMPDRYKFVRHGYGRDQWCRVGGLYHCWEELTDPVILSDGMEQ